MDVRVTVEREVPWWRFLVQWVLCIPHLLHSGALAALSGLAWIPMAVAVLVTGRVPRRLAEFQVLCLRERVRAYSYFFVLRRAYPPHATAMTAVDPGDDPLTSVAFELPSEVPRGAVLRAVVMIPHVLVLGPVGLVMDFGYPVLVLLGAVNRGWPEPVEEFLVRVERWVLGVISFVVFIEDEAPPFGLAGNDPLVGRLWRDDRRVA